MAKPKKFRIAVAGETIDGRVIEPQALKEAVETFDPAKYGVRVNVEHLRGLSGDKPFGMVGDVVALSVQDDDFTINGKTEKRTALYADIKPNDRGVELNKADQKVYSSVELLPNFFGTGKVGLMGVAVTDTPASMGTSRLQLYSAVGSLASSPHEVALKFEEDKPSESQSLYNNALSALTNAVTALTGGNKVEQKPDPVTPPSPPAGADQFGALFAAQTEAIKALGETVKDQVTSLTGMIEDQKREFDALKSGLEKQPSDNYTARQSSAGGSGVQQADF